MLAALVNVPANVGYPLLFLLVGAEAAGALVPGETSLIVAGTLAARGRLSIPTVIAVAATAAILGDNTGYLIGRRGLRHLLNRPGRWSPRRQRLVARGEAFFASRGPAAVFFARWLPGLRVVASWLAGANQMRWRRFLLWNALGGIAWASTVGTAAYLLGRTASVSLGVIGFASLAIAAIVYLAGRIRHLLHARGRGRPASTRPARPPIAANRPRRVDPTPRVHRRGRTSEQLLDPPGP